MIKVYSRIDWENEPSTDTPINETNLNKMDYALDQVDDRVISLDTTKANQTTINGCVNSINFEESTGKFTIGFVNGTSKVIDTLLEKIAINFDYNAQTQKIVITLEDGTTKEIDLSALITEYEFDDTATIDFSVSSGKVSASVKDGSITESKLQPNYLADIKVESAKAESAANRAETAAVKAERDASKYDDLNKSLTQLSYGAECGGKNLLPNIANELIPCHIESGTKLVASNSSTGVVNIRYYRADKTEIDYWALVDTASNRKYKAFTLVEDAYYFKWHTVDGSLINPMLEVGTTPTEYVSYIKSVYMLTDETTELNRNLETFGLNDKSNGLSNAYWSDAYVFTPSSQDVCCTTPLDCKAGDEITVTLANTKRKITVKYFNSSNTLISKTEIMGGKFYGVAPTNCVKFSYAFSGGNDTVMPNTGNIEENHVYINNAITKLNEDLTPIGGIIFVIKGQTISSSSYQDTGISLYGTFSDGSISSQVELKAYKRIK